MAHLPHLLLQSKQSEELTAKVQVLEGEKTSLQSVVAAQERQVAELIGKVCLVQYGACGVYLFCASLLAACSLARVFICSLAYLFIFLFMHFLAYLLAYLFACSLSWCCQLVSLIPGWIACLFSFFSVCFLSCFLECFLRHLVGRSVISLKRLLVGWLVGW